MNQASSDASVRFAYDRCGNLVTDAAAGPPAALVTYGCHLAARTGATTRSGTGTSHALYALGWIRTRARGPSVDTLTYEGAGTTVLQVASAGGRGVTPDGIADAAGTPRGTWRGSTVACPCPTSTGVSAASLPLAATAHWRRRTGSTSFRGSRLDVPPS